MKKTISVLCSLAIMLVCIGGCGAAAGNPFTADDAIKGQIGDLYYAVPENAVLEEFPNDSARFYNIPIENSAEEYMLNIACASVETDDDYDEAIQSMKDTEYENENLTDFLGEKVDYGYRATVDVDDRKSIIVSAAKDHKVYVVQYIVKSGFYDQTVWDNFYAQLKFV